MQCSTPGFPVHHKLLEITQTQVDWVSDAIQTSHPLVPFSSHLQSFPASEAFLVSQFFASGGQSIEVSASASVLPMNIQDWITLLKSWQVYVHYAAAAAAKSLQLCPTLWDPTDGSPPGSAVPGILHARTLEWVAISFSNTWKWKVKVKSLSHVRLFATPWTAAYQAPPSMGFFQARALECGAIAFSISIANDM